MVGTLRCGVPARVQRAEAFRAPSTQLGHPRAYRKCERRLGCIQKIPPLAAASRPSPSTSSGDAGPARWPSPAAVTGSSSRCLFFRPLITTKRAGVDVKCSTQNPMNAVHPLLRASLVVNPAGASEAGSFVTGPQRCGRYARGLKHERIPPAERGRGRPSGPCPTQPAQRAVPHPAGPALPCRKP